MFTNLPHNRADVFVIVGATIIEANLAKFGQAESCVLVFVDQVVESDDSGWGKGAVG